MRIFNPDPYADVESLLPAFRNGCEIALGRLYSQLSRGLKNYASRLTKEEGAAEDIITESFLKLWEHRAKMDSIKGLKAYLYTTIRHACFKYLDAELKRSQVYEEWCYLSLGENKTEEEESQQLLHRVLAEINLMPAQMQTVFNLSYIKRLRAAVVAEKLSLSVHTVQTQKKRALKRLRCAVAKVV